MTPAKIGVHVDLFQYLESTPVDKLVTKSWDLGARIQFTDIILNL